MLSLAIACSVDSALRPILESLEQREIQVVADAAGRGRPDEGLVQQVQVMPEHVVQRVAGVPDARNVVEVDEQPQVVRRDVLVADVDVQVLVDRLVDPPGDRGGESAQEQPVPRFSLLIAMQYAVTCPCRTLT